MACELVQTLFSATPKNGKRRSGHTRLDWIDQFESIASINGWNDEQKLIWLKVRLTGRALLAYKKFSVTARASFKNVDVALAERFEPESRRDLYLAEFMRMKGSFQNKTTFSCNS